MGEHPSLQGHVQQPPLLNHPSTGLCPPAPSLSSDGALCSCLLVWHQPSWVAFSLAGALLHGYVRGCGTGTFGATSVAFPGFCRVSEVAWWVCTKLPCEKGKLLMAQGEVAWRWGGLFDPAAAAPLPGLGEMLWPCSTSQVNGEHLFCWRSGLFSKAQPEALHSRSRCGNAVEGAGVRLLGWQRWAHRLGAAV